jgi:hypothetical protein
LAEAERLAAQAAADRAAAADDLRKAVAERKAAELARRETTGAQAEMSAFLRRANAALGGS